MNFSPGFIITAIILNSILYILVDSISRQKEGLARRVSSSVNAISILGLTLTATRYEDLLNPIFLEAGAGLVYRLIETNDRIMIYHHDLMVLYAFGSLFLGEGYFDLVRTLLLMKVANISTNIVCLTDEMNLVVRFVLQVANISIWILFRIYYPLMAIVDHPNAFVLYFGLIWLIGIQFVWLWGLFEKLDRTVCWF